MNKLPLTGEKWYNGRARSNNKKNIMGSIIRLIGMVTVGMSVAWLSHGGSFVIFLIGWVAGWTIVTSEIRNEKRT